MTTDFEVLTRSLVLVERRGAHGRIALLADVVMAKKRCQLDAANGLHLAAHLGHSLGGDQRVLSEIPGQPIDTEKTNKGGDTLQQAEHAEDAEGDGKLTREAQIARPTIVQRVPRPGGGAIGRTSSAMLFISAGVGFCMS